MDNLVTIPIKPYLKQMLIENYDCYPFTLNDPNDPIKKFIEQRVELTLFNESDRAKLIKEEKYDDELQLEYGVDMIIGFNLEVSLDSIIKINKYLTKVFNDLLYNYVLARHKEINDIRDAIFSFMEEYDITDDHIDYDSLRKKYYRYRQDLIKERPLVKRYNTKRKQMHHESGNLFNKS
jgi:hypothetical protein